MIFSFACLHCGRYFDDSCVAHFDFPCYSICPFRSFISMCVSRYRMTLLTISAYNFSGKVSVGSSSLQARLICRVAGSASPAEQQVNCNSARCRILRTIDSASGSGEASRVFISWLNREDSMEWILLAPCGEQILSLCRQIQNNFSRSCWESSSGRIRFDHIPQWRQYHWCVLGYQYRRSPQQHCISSRNDCRTLE